ncbi:MAG: hypothetical protein JM58_07465 [Peptococcaceae bacterium BICA1-8]|nr:MAG: hypothetical protein JM58_07465 [Peptococcaceae bacterium BICA1-8]
MNPIQIVLSEKMTVEETSKFRNELNDYLEQGERSFIINFGKCQFIDSTGLGVLVSVYKKCTERGGDFKLCSINNPNVNEVFRLTRLIKVFPIYTSYEEALKS